MTRRASVREALRAATRETHQRLHRHPGLSAAARGAIDLDDYRQLLMRLYGFHRAFEDTHAGAMQKLGFDASSRAELIALDLAAVGTMRFDVCRLPRCTALREPSSEACALGALYVVEGSALGGALIAAALAPVVGEARRFFLGPSRAEVWPSLLARVETLAPGMPQASAIDAAIETFLIFEEWMLDWRAASSPFAHLAIAASSETKGGVP